jgi:hypothetical protein
VGKNKHFLFAEIFVTISAFFVNTSVEIEIFFLRIFLQKFCYFNLPAGTLSSVFLCKILFCKHYFSPLNTFMRKGKDPDPCLLLMDPDLGGPKTCESGSPTLFFVTNVPQIPKAK